MQIGGQFRNIDSSLGVCGENLLTISAITRKLRQSGVRQDGQQTDLVWDKQTVRGKERTIVSTDKHLATERDVVALTKTLAADRSSALSPAAIDRAAELIAAARRPVAVLGSSAMRIADPALLLRVIEHYGLPFATTTSE